MLYDCIVVGSGHAGSCAAFSAAQSGCRKVLMIDKCPPEWAGGNGFFTAGAHRTVHDGLTDVLGLVSNVPSAKASQIDLEPYTVEQFTKDIQRLSQGRSNQEIVNAVVTGSRSAIQWLKDDIGIDFTMSFNRQAYEVGGRQVFWGGMALSVRDGGKGLIEAHHRALDKLGVERRFNVKAIELLADYDGVKGLKVQRLSGGGQFVENILTSPCIVLAAGGFEASPELRKRYLGQEWGSAKVRGTPYNSGDGFEMARLLGARFVGDWAGCHSTCWDANASDDKGERGLTNQYTKSGYPLGIMVNKQGNRFVDEGEDFRNYTYAKFGRAILKQPDGFVFQIWDSKVIDKLRAEEYGDGVVEKIYAESLVDLTGKLVERGLLTDAKQNLLNTIQRFNEAVERHEKNNPHIQWDAAIKDGKGTEGLDLSKSNWALKLDEPPFMAVRVACGITFTFGGLGIDPAGANVLREDGSRIEGLYCTGEMVGDLFYGNYPGGSGLTAGAVFGRKAGKSVAERIKALSS